MTAAETAIVAAARACVGARFRVHGRDPALGLDCVGLVAIACRLADVPTGYALRGGREADALRMLDEAGLAEPAQGRERPGDVMLLRAGAFQLHLAVATPSGFVHADAGLRRVVEMPGAPRWPLLARRRSIGG